MHELLMKVTQDMPMKIIPIDGKPYLERYFVGLDDIGNQLWLHRILRSDPERWLHTHPFKARSQILYGWYKEERKVFHEIKTTSFHPGANNYIEKDTLHRIAEAAPNTWSFLTVYPGREETWKFIGDNGREVVMKSSGENWHREHGNRAREYHVFNSYEAIANSLQIPYEDVVKMWDDTGNHFKIRNWPPTGEENVDWIMPKIGFKIPNYNPGHIIQFIGFHDYVNTPKPNLCKSSLGVISSKPKQALSKQALSKHDEPEKVNNWREIKFWKMRDGQIFKTSSDKTYVKIGRSSYRAVDKYDVPFGRIYTTHAATATYMCRVED